MARLHWRFLLPFQRRFQNRLCKLLAIPQRFESPVAYTGHLKSPRNCDWNHRKNRGCKWAFRPWESNAFLVLTFMRFQYPWIVFKPRLIPLGFHALNLNNISSCSCSDINECASSPCQNEGICNDLVNSYTCTCPTRYKGEMCETSKWIGPLIGYQRL